MSQENIEMVRAAYAALADALRTGEYADTLDAFCAPDVVFVPAGILPETSEMHGYEGLQQFAATQAEAFDDYSVEPKAFVAAGDKTVVPLRFGGRAAHTGLATYFDVVHVCTTQDGKLTRVDVYATEAEALKAVGLEE
jgi:ketosteroid isomerase-like protein